ncbi:hypothetical protein MNV49_003483 [Pseudohyphozyma bogoriensis]|nr:hypothetical protein MNV49_003483 [Pseudohyphozyma bogoriensis]
MSAAAPKTQLVVFDFDWSFADQDTDRYVFEVLSPPLRKSLRAHKVDTQWTDNVRNHLVKLHEQGVSREQIEKTLQGLPVHHNMSDFFHSIITNPASFADSGLLQLNRRVSPEGVQHGCKVGCSANMCKGKELDEFIVAQGGWDKFDRIVYVGDGGNDFCPVLRLRTQDVALVRMYRELTRRILKEAGPGGFGKIQARIVEWGGAWEVEDFLLNGKE